MSNMMNVDSSQSIHSFSQNGSSSFSPTPQESNIQFRQRQISFLPSASSIAYTDHSKSASPTPPVPLTKSNQSREIRNQENKNTFILSSQRNPGRLPATIDASLTQQCQITRTSFLKALSNDQFSASQPDYHTPFISANDVVRRLLPYHVWHVRDEDLIHVLDNRLSTKKRSNEEEEEEGESQKMVVDDSQRVERIDNGGPSRQAKKSKKKKKISIDQYIDDFPNSAETDSLWQRYMYINSRAKGLLNSMIGANNTNAAAPFAQESRYHLEKLAWEDEKELMSKEHEAGRLSREEAIAKGVQWPAIMRILNNETEGGNSNDESSSGEDEDDSDAESNSNITSNIPDTSMLNSKYFNESMGTPFSPINQFAPRGMPKTRGRPRKERDEQGRIIRPPSTPATVSKEVSTPTPTSFNQDEIDKDQQGLQVAYTPTQSISNPPLESEKEKGSDGNNLKLETTSKQTVSSTSASTSSSYVIPSEPIRLILPFSTLTQLSALGISPVPAPHLLPVISARQAAIASGETSNFSFDKFDTAPRQSPKGQQEAALLMGITTTPTGSKGKEEITTTSTIQDQNRTEMIHVSLILSKLGPAQLSGLATLMQNMQQAATAASTSTSTSTNNSK